MDNKFNRIVGAMKLWKEFESVEYQTLLKYDSELAVKEMDRRIKRVSELIEDITKEDLVIEILDLIEKVDCLEKRIEGS